MYYMFFGIMGITDVILVLTLMHFGMKLTGIVVSVVISTAVADVAGLILVRYLIRLRGTEKSVQL